MSFTGMYKHFQESCLQSTVKYLETTDRFHLLFPSSSCMKLILRDDFKQFHANLLDLPRK